jgi:RNA polymerase sigma factor (sigma-70 family)
MLTLTATSGGSLASFDDEFEGLWAIAYRVAFRVLGTREDAEDVAQDSLERVGAQWKRVQTYAKPFTAHVAGQRAIDLWRRRTRRAGTEAAFGVDRLGFHGDPAVDVGTRDDLVAALGRLPKRQRQVVILRYLADFTEHDTATALGCSVGSVKTHASRGLAALRVSLPSSQEID